MRWDGIPPDETVSVNRAPWTLALLVACSPHAPPARASAAQDVHGGLVVLCASRWNGELYGSRFLRWIPDELHHTITNDEVMKLVTALSDPARDRTGMFDAFVAENRVARPPACPFRDRLASWPTELPILPPQ